MKIIYCPYEKEVADAMKNDEPMLVLIAFDGGTVIVGQIDDAFEHHILLLKAGFSAKDIDKYFKVVLDSEGADWTFVCPPDYRNITDKERRIKQFYKDGFAVISDAVSELGYFVNIDIPKRYRRHFEYVYDG